MSPLTFVMPEVVVVEEEEEVDLSKPHLQCNSSSSIISLNNNNLDNLEVTLSSSTWTHNSSSSGL